MSPELIAAIKDRLTSGQTKEAIKTAVLAMGHTEAVFEAAFILAEHDVEKATIATIPRVFDLFKQGWNFTLSRLDIVALLSLPLVLEVLATHWFQYDALGNTMPPLPLIGIYIALGLMYVLTMFVGLFVVTRPKEEATVPAAVHFAVTHAVPLLCIYLLSGLIVFGGFMLFLIPGVVIAIMITFAQFVFAVEGKRGMAALLASRALVTGRWFLVAGKIIGFSLISFLVVLCFLTALSIVGMFVGDGTYTLLTVDVFSQFFVTILTLVNFYAMFQLYLALKATRPEPAATGTVPRIAYGGVTLLGAMTIVLLVLAAVLYEDSLDWVAESSPALSERGTDVPAEFLAVSTTATQYAKDRSGSYVGVCEVLQPLVADLGAVTCNDSETAWALETSSAGDRFCADTATPGKRIAVALGTKTECISVGE